MPDMASFSYYQRLNDQWDLLGDVTWTGWSSIPELRIVRTSGPATGAPTVLPQNWKNTWRFSAGVNYSPDEKWVLRAGVAFDQTPVNSTDMSPRLPDGDRTWLALGARYKYSREINFDVGVGYEFVKDPQINSGTGGMTSGFPNSVAGNGLVNGTYSNSVLIVSAQMNYRFR
jgi:long-chain fatty acid transport protein